jgi:hypothetical protein
MLQTVQHLYSEKMRKSSAALVASRRIVGKGQRPALHGCVAPEQEWVQCGQFLDKAESRPNQAANMRSMKMADENQLTLIEELAAVEWKPQAALQREALAESVKKYASAVLDWDMLNDAVDQQISDQRNWVEWWDANVRKGRPESVEERATLIFREDAEKLGGISRFKTNRWKSPEARLAWLRRADQSCRWKSVGLCWCRSCGLFLLRCSRFCLAAALPGAVIQLLPFPWAELESLLRLAVFGVVVGGFDQDAVLNPRADDLAALCLALC